MHWNFKTVTVVMYATVYYVSPTYFPVFCSYFYQFAGQNKPITFQI